MLGGFILIHPDSDSDDVCVGYTLFFQAAKVECGNCKVPQDMEPCYVCIRHSYNLSNAVQLAACGLIKKGG